MLPDTKIPLPRWVGEYESLLNVIRKEEKVWIWHEQGENAMRVSGSKLEMVEVATARVKNLYLKVVSKPLLLFPRVHSIATDSVVGSHACL